MKTNNLILTVFLLFLANNAVAVDTDRLMRSANRYFSPLPETMPGSENDTQEKIALGKKLYFEKRLSINNTQACASCHKLEKGFAGGVTVPWRADGPAGENFRETGDVFLRVSAIDANGMQFENLTRKVFVQPAPAAAATARIGADRLGVVQVQ